MESSLLKIDLEKALINYDRVMAAARFRVLGEGSSLIGESQAVSIIRLLRLDRSLKTEVVLNKLVELLHVDWASLAERHLRVAHGLHATAQG